MESETNTSGAFLRPVVASVLVAVAYVLAARVGLSMAVVAEQVTLLWPPTGIALAALVVGGRRLWPAVAVGAFVANLMHGAPPLVAAGIAAGNTLEALVGQHLLARAGFSPRLERLRDVLALVLFAAGASTLVSASVGVVSLCAGGLQPWSRFGVLWRDWWLGDMGGDLIFAPALLTWMGRAQRPETPEAWAKAGALLAAVTAAALLLLIEPGGMHALGYPLEYLVFPLLAVAAVRGGTLVTALGILITATVATAGSSRGVGPFVRAGPHESLMLVQLYTSVVSVTALVLAAVTREGQRARDEVQRLNRDLQRRVDELQALLDVSPVAIAVARDPACQSITGNPACAEVLGISLDANASKSGPAGDRLPFKVLQNGRELTVDELPMQQAAARGEALRDIEVDIVRDDGRVLNLLEYAIPLFDEERRVRGCMGVWVDITVRRRLEDELRRRVAELAEADRRKDEFLAMLAHELRNPLSPIAASVEVLRASSPGDPAAERAMGIVARQVKHVTRLVDDLLDVSRITRGKIRLVREEVDLGAAVADAVEANRPSLESHRHAFDLRLPEGALTLTADRTRLVQVVSNLLHNAVKFTPPGGHLALEVAIEGDRATLRVRDDGLGIEAELLPRVFDMFVQGATALDRSRGGLGLGLTLVRSLVEMHGGTVTAESGGPGRGSVFTVTLPGCRHEPAVEPVRVTPPMSRALRVMVVEDNSDSAEILTTLLELEGHTARAFHDGPSALAAVAEFRPEVALVDLGLPGMDGYELGRRLREDPALKGLLMVVLSGYGQDEDRRRSREVGFDEHFVKPVDPDVLRELLATRAVSSTRTRP